MEKTIAIDGVEVKLKSSAVTYIKYRSVFREDLFTGLQDIGSKISDGQVFPEGAVELLLKATYIMATQAGEKRGFEDWLDQFSLRGSLDCIGEVYEMLLDDQAPIEEAKKNNDRLSEE